MPFDVANRLTACRGQPRQFSVFPVSHVADHLLAAYRPICRACTAWHWPKIGVMAHLLSQSLQRPCMSYSHRDVVRKAGRDAAVNAAHSSLPNVHPDAMPFPAGQGCILQLLLWHVECENHVMPMKLVSLHEADMEEPVGV